MPISQRFPATASATDQDTMAFLWIVPKANPPFATKSSTDPQLLLIQLLTCSGITRRCFGTVKKGAQIVHEALVIRVTSQKRPLRCKEHRCVRLFDLIDGHPGRGRIIDHSVEDHVKLGQVFYQSAQAG